MSESCWPPRRTRSQPGTSSASGTPGSAWGPTRDVVMIDAELEQAYGLDEVPDNLAQQYAMQADWDPRKAGDRMQFLVLRPLRIQAWREVNKLPGRHGLGIVA
jgi:hypothetical protein